jgi:hypothetical protein
MSDPTVKAMQQIKAFAEEQAAIVERVEVALREVDGRTSVEFTAYLSPVPLKQSTACIGYWLDDEPA